jgi:hypothetical protein
MCKEMPVIPVNRVVDEKRIIERKWRAGTEERYKGSLTQKNFVTRYSMTTVFRVFVRYSRTRDLGQLSTSIRSSVKMLRPSFSDLESVLENKVRPSVQRLYFFIHFFTKGCPR